MGRKDEAPYVIAHQNQKKEMRNCGKAESFGDSLAFVTEWNINSELFLSGYTSTFNPETGVFQLTLLFEDINDMPYKEPAQLTY